MPPIEIVRELVGGWVLDDPSDQGAAAFLAELAEMLRTVIAEAESARP